MLTDTTEEKYVGRVKNAILETEILYHADMMNEAINPIDVLDCFEVRAERIQFTQDDVKNCVEVLVKDGHLKRAKENKVEITEDGRDDVKRTRDLIKNFGAEIEKGVVCPGGKEKQTTTNV